MKGIPELEKRWRNYRLRTLKQYLLLALLLLLIIVLSYLLMQQYQSYQHNKSKRAAREMAARATKNAKNQNKVSSQNNLSPSNISQIAKANNCREVTSWRLNVREQPSSKSPLIGFYSRGGIFCVNYEAGLWFKLDHGWASANDQYSVPTDANISAGFNQYVVIKDSNITTNKTQKKTSKKTNNKADKATKVIIKEDIKEFKIKDPIATPSPKNTLKITNGKKKLNISSQVITKEEDISLKQEYFMKHQDYHDAIAIANYYYDLKDYDNSIKWALNASSVKSYNKSKLDSFVIYAKSLYRLDRKEEGIEVLENYIATTQSQEAKDILNDIKRGNL